MLDKERREKAGIVVQCISACLSGAGLGYEVAVGADIGFILITAGAIAFGIGAKLRKI